VEVFHGSQRQNIHVAPMFGRRVWDLRLEQPRAWNTAAQDAALATQIVDAMNKVYGVHPGFRANHAKGVVAEGFLRRARALI